MESQDVEEAIYGRTERAASCTAENMEPRISALLTPEQQSGSKKMKAGRVQELKQRYGR
jgi:hypothetical protein